ncbi:MAG: DUF58 domain-containing protein [Planctomycetes bacterium]|nr:DUF58 domain-containing protein [Planctomycetota bacterium]
MALERIPPELSERPLVLAAKRLADDLSLGEDRSLYVGPGLDYAQSRPFVDGDSVRDIDWRVTARTRRYHVKEFEVLKRLAVMLLVDTSASMRFASGAVSKRDLAITLSGAIGLAALRRQSPVGVLGGSTRDFRFPPSLARNRWMQWLHALVADPFDGATRLASRIDELGGLLRARCLVIAISDLHDPEAVPALKRLGQRHETIVLQVEDPAEHGRLRAGFVRAREAETGFAAVAHGFTRWFGKGGRRVGEELQASGVDHLLVRTDRPFVGELRRFLRERGVIGRNAR